ncbi:MAG: RidA family protein [Alphaproteobacteria bacterium]|nr:RidA family protein [Alphaproteobacteria bacterium]
MPTIEKYAAKSVYDPPIYAQAVKVTGEHTTLYIAGQVDYDDRGGCAHPGDFAAQTRGVLAALKAQVEAGGGTLANIVKMNTYVTDMRNRAEFGPIRTEFFGGKAPASTMVAISALAHPDFLIEIEAVAVV